MPVIDDLADRGLLLQEIEDEEGEELVGEEDDEAPIPPPEPRPRPAAPPLRQPVVRTEKPTGTSPWVGQPREGFTDRQQARVPLMRVAKESKYVPGVTREHQEPRPRRDC